MRSQLCLVPVFQAQAGNALELIQITADKRRLQCDSGGRNQQIVRPDEIPRKSKVVADLPVSSRTERIERDDGEGREEPFGKLTS